MKLSLAKKIQAVFLLPLGSLLLLGAFTGWNAPRHEAALSAAETRARDVLPADDRRLLNEQLDLARRHANLFLVAFGAAALAAAALTGLAIAWTRSDLRAHWHAQEERSRIIDLSLDLLCVANADGYFKSVNPAFVQTLGWTTEELLTRPFLQFVHPEDRDATLREVQRQVVAGEPVVTFENRYLHKDGSWRWLSWKSVPQPGGFMYAAARDVTERKSRDDELARLNRDLAAQTAELQKVNRDLESFTYSVSHDLRAPLRSIDGFSRILVKRYGPQFDAEGLRLLNVVSDESKRMGRLIDDLLRFCRLGRHPMSRSRINMALLAQDVIASLTHAGPQKSPYFELNQLPAGQGDPTMIRQVWGNLLANAVKFTSRRDGPVIKIGGEVQNGVSTYYIKDNGCGFDQKYAHKLFGVFQRLHGRNDFEGTGVGLAMVQRIIHRHGGNVWAEGKPNDGATFYFTLPYADAA